MDIKNKKVLITGDEGFLGSYVCSEVRKLKPKSIIIPGHFKHDLRKRSVCREVVEGVDVVIHMAAQIGDIGFIDEIPGEIFYNNAVMGIELMEVARKAGVKKFVTIGTVCEYPERVNLPFSRKKVYGMAILSKQLRRTGGPKKFLLFNQRLTKNSMDLTRFIYYRLIYMVREIILIKSCLM